MSIPAAICLLAALPGRAGAVGAAIGLISFPIGQLLFSRAYWDDLIRRIWRKEGLQSVDGPQRNPARRNIGRRVRGIGIGSHRIRMATGYWRKFWDEESLPSDASRTDGNRQQPTA